ncbi:hypothetical protein BS47DRAFT_1481942, partial [Hydnum rufescens UP504]
MSASGGLSLTIDVEDKQFESLILIFKECSSRYGGCAYLSSWHYSKTMRWNRPNAPSVPRISLALSYLSRNHDPPGLVAYHQAPLLAHIFPRTQAIPSTVWRTVRPYWRHLSLSHFQHRDYGSQNTLDKDGFVVSAGSKDRLSIVSPKISFETPSLTEMTDEFLVLP